MPPLIRQCTYVRCESEKLTFYVFVYVQAITLIFNVFEWLLMDAVEFRLLVNLINRPNVLECLLCMLRL